jgi:hypothetical protein
MASNEQPYSGNLNIVYAFPGRAKHFGEYTTEPVLEECTTLWYERAFSQAHSGQDASHAMEVAISGDVWAKQTGRDPRDCVAGSIVIAELEGNCPFAFEVLDSSGNSLVPPDTWDGEILGYNVVPREGGIMEVPLIGNHRECLSKKHGQVCVPLTQRDPEQLAIGLNLRTINRGADLGDFDAGVRTKTYHNKKVGGAVKMYSCAVAHERDGQLRACGMPHHFALQGMRDDFYPQAEAEGEDQLDAGARLDPVSQYSDPQYVESAADELELGAKHMLVVPEHFHKERAIHEKIFGTDPNMLVFKFTRLMFSPSVTLPNNVMTVRIRFRVVFPARDRQAEYVGAGLTWPNEEAGDTTVEESQILAGDHVEGMPDLESGTSDSEEDDDKETWTVESNDVRAGQNPDDDESTFSGMASVVDEGSTMEHDPMFGSMDQA